MVSCIAAGSPDVRIITVMCHVWAIGFGQVEVGHGDAFERVAVDVADLAYNRGPRR